MDLDSLQVLVQPTVALDSLQIVFPDTVVTKVQIIGKGGGDSNLSSYVVILVALTAGVLALIQVRLNVSMNARVKFIEELYHNLGGYVASIQHSVVLHLNSKNPKIPKEVRQKSYDEYLESVERSNASGAKVSLIIGFINPKSSKPIEIQLNAISEKLMSEEDHTTKSKDLTDLTSDLQDSVAQIMHKEWKKI